MQKTDMQQQSANLAGNTNATIIWRYHAPLRINVAIRPYGGCSDDTKDCHVGIQSDDARSANAEHGQLIQELFAVWASCLGGMTV